MKTEAGKTNLQGIINSAQNTIDSRTAMLDSLLEMELIRDNEYNVMKNNVASAGYDNMNTQIVGQAVKQSNLESNREWLTNMEELKGINTQLVAETKNIGTAIYADPKAQEQLNMNIEMLKARKSELLKQMKVGSKTNREDETPGTVTLAGGGTLSGSDYDSFVQGTSDDFPLSIWSSQFISIGENGEKYQTSVVTNRRVFVANIKYTDGSGNLVNRGDQIRYSLINKFNSFPEFNFIDIGVNDGEDFVKLEAFADRLFAYKEKTLYIINIGGGSDTQWFLESENKNMGVEFHAATVKTDFGIAWVNKNGLFFYDGSQIRNLQTKILESQWSSFVNADTMIGYEHDKSHS